MDRDLVLVIDMQNVYAEGGAWYCESIAESVTNIVKLIESADDKVNIAFTKFIASNEPEGTWTQYNVDNRAVNEDVHANEIVEDLAQYEQRYRVYEKSKYSSMSIDELRQEAMSTIGKCNVVVTGVVAECCVLFTVTELIDMGASVIYLTDAVSGINSETEEAVLTILEGLSPLHVRCMTTDEYIRVLK